MTFTYDSGLQTHLDVIEKELLRAFPAAAKEAETDQLAYALFLWYEDSSSSPDLVWGLATQADMNYCAITYSETDSRIQCLWRPQQEVPGLKRRRIRSKEFAAGLGNAYASMMAANRTGRPLADEGKLLLPLRTTLHRVAQRLNQLDWSQTLRVSKEFVVVAGDMIGYWTRDDLHASIPAEKRDSARRAEMALAVS